MKTKKKRKEKNNNNNITIMFNFIVVIALEQLQSAQDIEVGRKEQQQQPNKTRLNKTTKIIRLNIK